MKRGEKRLSSLSEKYGTDSQEYKDALRNITLKNAWYKDMVNTTTKQLAEVNQTALAYVQDQMPEVYALNYNQFGRELEKAGISDEDSIRFNLVDEATVRRMIKDGDIEMPYQKKRLSIPKDQRWNTRQINSSVLQGIIQGESIGQIAKRLYPIMDNNVHAAVRNARTLVTGAESRGRMDSYKEAKDDGVVLNKVWLATADGRTRDWHVDMDGQEVGVDEEFTDGLGNALMYPGDPGGAPESVYNCRCALTTHIVGFQRADGSISYVDYEGEPDAHDAAMEKERERRGRPQPEKAQKKDEATAQSNRPKDVMGNSANGYAERDVENMKKLLRDDGKSAEVYSMVSDNMKEATDDQRPKKAFYTAGANRVHINRKAVVSGNNYNQPYQVHFHEYGHNMDFILGSNFGHYSNVPLSEGYRSADGKTFEEIIFSDWDKIILPRAEENLKEVMLENARLNLDTASGGMGWDTFASSEIAGYRKYAGLKRTSDEIKAMREEAFSYDNDTERLNWYYNNIEKFVASAKYGGAVSNMEIKEAKKMAVEDFCDEVMNKHSLVARTDISDMFERYSVKNGGEAYPFGVGHGKSYANREGALAKEAFAEMTAAEISNPESLELIKEYLPESYKAYQEMLDQALTKGD